MDTGIRSDLCRVTVIAPGARIDVALPAHVPLAEVMPTLLRQAGSDRVDDPGRGAWSLQRFGQAPLDTGLAPSVLTLLDGEVLYLRPRQAELPELAFDDVSDAVATAAGHSTRRWSEADTRRTGLAAAVAGLAGGALLVLSAGPSWTLPALVAGTVALALVVTATVLSRAFSDARAAQVPAFLGILFAAVGGALAFNSDRPLGRLGAPSAMGASAAALVVSVVVAFAVADGVPGLIGVGVAVLVALVAAALDIVAGVGAAGSAAVVVVLALGLTQLIPVLALRLAELPIPAIPFTADEVRRDTYLLNGADLLKRTVVADAYVTGLVGAVGLLAAGGQVLLSRQHEAGAQWLMAVAAAACALRARAFLGRLQRTFLLSAASVGGLLLVFSLAAQQSATHRLLLLLAPLLAVVAGLVVAALRLPGASVSPSWRRVTDMLDGAVVLSLIPVALNVLGVYGYVRGLGG